MFRYLVHPAHRDDQRLRRIAGLMAKETGVEAFVRQQLATISRADSRPYLDAISCPTLVIAGESDAVIPPDHSAELADGIPGAHLIEVVRAGHFTTLEQPEQVREMLVQWLDDPPGRP